MAVTKITKKALAMQLSKLKKLGTYRVELEQYLTDSEIAAEILWWAYLNKDIRDKSVADLGCGNGILGIGALLLGAKSVYFIDIDKDAIAIAKQNIKIFNKKNAAFICQSIDKFNKKVDIVIQNPPWGVQKRTADRKFLQKAMDISHDIYSIHKIESKEFIKAFSSQEGFEVADVLQLDFLLRKIYTFHKKERYYVKVGCWHLRKI